MAQKTGTFAGCGWHEKKIVIAMSSLTTIDLNRCAGSIGRDNHCLYVR